jgi:hypothetical protein
MREPTPKPRTYRRTGHRLPVQSGAWFTRRMLANRWNKSVRTIERYRERPDFPKAVDFYGSPMWRVEEIESWEASRPRTSKTDDAAEAWAAAGVRSDGDVPASDPDERELIENIDGDDEANCADVEALKVGIETRRIPTP